ncbi:sporulation protein Cse60 [Sporolactobacillus vineae]|uniref:sporulation protein Cse60 n=1 Tax=Sporolactobacillus vineae TaxID=444463 RepID=UPI000315E0C0|nr:sporulation protein Cse60 [Sporolactobacillus vineae]
MKKVKLFEKSNLEDLETSVNRYLSELQADTHVDIVFKPVSKGGHDEFEYFAMIKYDTI